MLSRPLTLSQSEHSRWDKAGMAPPSEPPVTRNPAPPLLPLAEDLNTVLPLAEDLNAVLPLAEDLNAVLPLAEDLNAVLPLAEACLHSDSASPPSPPSVSHTLLVSYSSSHSSSLSSSPPLSPPTSPPLSPPTSPPLSPPTSPPLSPPTSPLTPQMSPLSPSFPPNPVSPTRSPSSDSLFPQMFPPSPPSPPSPPLLVSPNFLLVSSPSPASSTTHISPRSPPCSPPGPPSGPSPGPPSGPPPGPCVLCSSMLPRLLSSLLSLHQKEMKRLIGGAMATFDQRLSALEQRLNEDRGDKVRGDKVRGDKVSWSEGEEPVAGPSQSGKRRRRREEKETRRKRRKHQSEQSCGAESQSQQSARTHDQSEQRVRTAGQSERSVCAVAGQNGLRAALLLRPQSSSVSHDALGDLGAWHFSGPAPCSSRRGDVRAVISWLMTLPGHTSVRQLPWRLSLVAVEMVVGVSLCDVTVTPEHPLQDHSAPPYISAEHSYVRSSVLSLLVSARRQQRPRANHSTRRRPLPLPSVPTNGLTVSLTTAQSAASADRPSNKKDVKRVSQIRIRRASPKETNLTPLGLPKVKRLKKKEFSLEEIYTNKNYRSPSVNSSSLETIFEEPREKDGALLLIGQQRRRRLLHFPDFTQPRKRKRAAAGVGLVAMAPRKRVAARRGCRDDDCDSDVMLLQRLSALQDFLQRQGLDQDSC